MKYVVISRFRDHVAGRYVDPGTPCPDLAPEDLERLERAGCVRAVPDAPPAGDAKPKPEKPKGRGGKKASASDSPTE